MLIFSSPEAADILRAKLTPEVCRRLFQRRGAEIWNQWVKSRDVRVVVRLAQSNPAEAKAFCNFLYQQLPFVFAPTSKEILEYETYLVANLNPNILKSLFPDDHTAVQTAWTGIIQEHEQTQKNNSRNIDEGLKGIENRFNAEGDDLVGSETETVKEPLKMNRLTVIACRVLYLWAKTQLAPQQKPEQPPLPSTELRRPPNTETVQQGTGAAIPSSTKGEGIQRQGIVREVDGKPRTFFLPVRHGTTQTGRSPALQVQNKKVQPPTRMRQA